MYFLTTRAVPTRTTFCSLKPSCLKFSNRVFGIRPVQEIIIGMVLTLSIFHFLVYLACRLLLGLAMLIGVIFLCRLSTRIRSGPLLAVVWSVRTVQSK